MKKSTSSISHVALVLLAASQLHPTALFAASSLNVVNAASQQAVSLAPGSIVTIYGTNLTAGVAVTHGALNPPASLGGVTVTVGGKAAGLYYVSPTAINAVLDSATPAGVQTVVVTSSTGTQQASVTVDANAPPGIFSLNGIGTGDGAFVNALTALLGPFTPGTTKGTTYLELYLTGLNLSHTPTVTVGGVSVTVTFSGASPCCAGLDQIDVQIPTSLAGSGRVPVVVTDNGQVSNTVQVVLLPTASGKEFPSDQDDHARVREIASLAYVPGSSLVLSSDENDDVVRVIDVSARSITKVIALSDGAAPEGIAVNANGTTAVVAERGLGQAAILNLATMTVAAEVSTGTGSAPVSAAIGGTLAVVVNRDTRTASVIDLTSKTVVKSIDVGHGPHGVAVDTTGTKAYVTNEDDGTISVIDLVGLTVTSTVTVDANARLEGIALLPAPGFAFVTAPASGQVFLVNLTGGTATSISANAAGAGSTDIAILNGNVYFANQAGGSVSVLPINPMTGAAAGPVTTIKVDLGARAIAIDTKDNLLVVSNEGTGTLVLVSLSTNTVTGRINAVRSNMSGDDNGDDHSDHDGSDSGRPSLISVSPVSGAAGSNFTLTIAGNNLTGATNVTFTVPSFNEDNDRMSMADTAFTITNIQVNAAGTQLTATAAIAASATPGVRIVRVVTPKGTSSFALSAVDTFTVNH